MHRNTTSRDDDARTSRASSSCRVNIELIRRINARIRRTSHDVVVTRRHATRDVIACVGIHTRVVASSSRVRRACAFVVAHDARATLRACVALDRALACSSSTRALFARATLRDTYLIAYDDAIDDATLNVRERDVDTYDECVFVACACASSC